MTDIQTEFGGTDPIGMNEYYAGGGLVPPGTTGTFGAVPSSGALSIQNFYGTSNYVPVYVEELFQTWLYTGNSSTQTIPNGVNLSGNGGMVWLKCRTLADSNQLFDTVRGGNRPLASNNDSAQGTSATSITAFNTNGFTMGNSSTINFSNELYTAWTFREQPNFFDVVTYTGNSSGFLTVNHNLGSVPGCIIVKCITEGSSENWIVYHRSGGTFNGVLNSTGSFGSGPFFSNITSTSFRLTGNSVGVSTSGRQYVAYLFAHNAGGFGPTGTDNIISCGGFTADGSGRATVNLGYEPQWILWKVSNQSGTDWFIHDVMRGWNLTANAGATARTLNPNLANAEAANQNTFNINPTGFTLNGFLGGSVQVVYITVRRGPMRIPTSGASVFSPIVSSASQGTKITTNFPVDLQIQKSITDGSIFPVTDRLRAVSSINSSGGVSVTTTSSAAESTSQNATRYWDNTGFQIALFNSGNQTVYWNFGRAPTFFEEVCYTGNGDIGQTYAHGLQVVPEMIIIKRRNVSEDWPVYHAALGATRGIYLNGTQEATTFSQFWNNTAPTSTVFSVGSSNINNGNASTYVAYLFASCPGVSQVSSYTGTGSTQVINCGFTSGARFILIRRTDVAGDWYVWDSARGIVSANDPYLRLNVAASQITNTDWVDPDSTGFALSNAGGNLVNTNGGSYIFLAIA